MAATIAQEFLTAVETAVKANNVPGIVECFRPDGWWRDHLIIDTGDFNSLRMPEIAPHLEKFGVPGIFNLKVVQPEKAVIVKVSEEVTWLQAFFDFETETTRGKGFIRLRESADGDWKAYTFYTALWEIKGHEEFAYERRPIGADHGEHLDRRNWLDRRKETIKFEKQDPAVLIIGGGQNGLMLAARLTVLGISTLIVEQNPRLGDSWRNRYHSLCLHDPVYADHFPYISYPPNWPIYCPKDKLANWFESYAESMELNVWLNSTISPDPVQGADGKWTVEVMQDGVPRTMVVNHLVLSSGFSGEAKLPSFPREEFTGTAIHSSKHAGGKLWRGKTAVVVGCCNSGHDIAADLYENGADVTIIQRSHTYVMSSKHGIPGLLDGYYQEGGPPIEDADLMLTSLPVDLLNEYHIEATKAIAVKDKDLLDSLTAVGFKLNPYPGGLFIKYFRDGGGYYIDVGASGLIASKKIKLKQGKEITKLTSNGVLFEDGVELPADLVVMATGYSSIRDTVKRVISTDVAERLGTCWGQDKQGEIPSVWRHSGVPNFWIQVGNMFQARCYSKWTALQIQQLELGAKAAEFPTYKAVVDARF